MQESVGGAFAQLNEAEALGRIEPLDHGFYVPLGDFVPVEIMVILHHTGHSKTCKERPYYVLHPSQCRATRRRLSALSAISTTATVITHLLPCRLPDPGAHTPVTLPL